jgi:hypothetical protein
MLATWDITCIAKHVPLWEYLGLLHHAYIDKNMQNGQKFGPIL